MIADMGTVRMYRRRHRGRVAWRWQILHRNGRIIGASSEAYRNRSDCHKNLLAVTRARNFLVISAAETPAAIRAQREFPFDKKRRDVYVWKFSSGAPL